MRFVFLLRCLFRPLRFLFFVPFFFESLVTPCFLWSLEVFEMSLFIVVRSLIISPVSGVVSWCIRRVSALSNVLIIRCLIDVHAMLFRMSQGRVTIISALIFR